MNAEPVEILLVEDNPDDLELTLLALRRYNLANRVHVVSDGVEALDYLGPNDGDHVPAEGYPKLVLLDLKVPRVDGLEILRRLKSSEATRTIPVVVLTSSREERDLVESYRLGVNSYVVKPLDFEQFLNEVSSLGLYWLDVNKVPS